VRVNYVEILQNLINKLENIQLDAARIVTGGTRLTSHDSLYEETKWEKLKDRRNNHKLVLLFSDSKLRVGSGKSFHAFTVEGRKYSE
jgi:hypothetical protein